MPHIKRALSVSLAASLIVMVLAPHAAAATRAELRVVGLQRTLDPGTTYLTGTETLPAASDAGCSPTGENHRVAGATALGILGSAFEANRALRPLGVAEDEYGLRVCRMGPHRETDTPSFTGWLFRVNHRISSSGAALHRLEPGDSALWYFADFGNKVNTGDELVLRAPVRSRPGAVAVRVIALGSDFNTGEITRRPAPDGTIVRGGVSPATTVDGVAEVRLTEPGSARLRASHRPDIPSAPVAVCVARDLDRCPTRRGSRIVGTSRADSIDGTAGPDVIRARAGADRVDVRGGGADRVDCGDGRDRVDIDSRDRTRNCEIEVG